VMSISLFWAFESWYTVAKAYIPSFQWQNSGKIKAGSELCNFDVAKQVSQIVKNSFLVFMIL